LVFGYNAQGQHVRTDYPDGYTVHQTLNALGQSLQLQDGAGRVLANNVSYSADGEISSLTYGNGIQRTVQENGRQVTGRIVDGGVLDLSYSYDPSGNIVEIADAVRGGPGHITLAYDRLDRLVRASAPSFGGSGHYTFGYDTLDNIVSMRLPGVRERTFHYDAKNRLELLRDENSSGVEGFAYDAAGNLSVKNGQPLAFDVGGLLRSVNGGDAYFYDGAGLRAYAAGGRERSWQNLIGGELIESTQDDETSDYVYLNSQLIAIRTNSAAGEKLTYLHYDALKTLAAVSDANGAVVKRHFWSPYGEPDSLPESNAPGYSGHLSDPDSGLIYMGQRYYDPKLARFISPDPLAARTSDGRNFNRYRYANNNPFKFSDPTGACEQVTGSHRCEGGGFAGDRLDTIQYASGSIPTYDPNAPSPVQRESATGLDAVAEFFGERNWFVGQGSLTDIDALSEAIVVPAMNTPGGGTVAGGAKLASVLLVARVGMAAKGFGNLSRAAEFRIAPYNVLKRAVGTGSGLHVHHLLEKRFSEVLMQKKGHMLSIVVTPAEHQVFTNAWHAAIGYKRDVSPAEISAAARRIYANYPAVLNALGL